MPARAGVKRWAGLGLIGSVCALAAGCGAAVRPSATLTVAPAVSTRTGTAPAPPAPAAPAKPAKPRPAARPKPRPGSLPQTHQLPSSKAPAFRAEMASLWHGIQANSATGAMPAFFPEGAYIQVKAIADPSGDYAERLLGAFRLDLAAAHGLLGSNPGSARLVAVDVPQAYAHWVDPGACYNRVGYYEVPNARLVYRLDGQLRSFGIASMISWRGAWYVVHLGAVVRSVPGGVVDDPSLGSGNSAPSSTC